MTKKINIYKKHSNYLKLSRYISMLSPAFKKKVGCLLVKDGKMISIGYNKSLDNFDKYCENVYNKTKWYVTHAEENCIFNLSKIDTISGSTLYTTLSPCKNCAKLILQAKISEVYYDELYKDTEGIRFLNNNKIKCYKISSNDRM